MTLPDDRREAVPDPIGSELRKEAYIGLGSNLGDRETYLQDAIRELGLHPLVDVVRVSDIYETEPVGYADQGRFLNMVAVVSTTLPPASLHHHMKEIEDGLGRIRTIRNGPRTVDLDLLLMDDNVLDTSELIIPHPRMWERAFVLVPMRDAAKGKPHLLATIAGHLDRLEGKEGVTRWSNFNWRSVSERSGS
ncbi:2-amino-4-hydroxy-6-hydroxymethyldihydropteridine diphosphokinase [Paenibacillus hemerocallicola]|uniref:2-amino-4-hydroxy-6-hydroxymethyldihydropteridine diphosphokinase n=1 Tax=Paenibacillus hemerocallicola TaxID=1172614 RepID=A0A5C4T2K9_9BACL|nr:2-amino-4-hydroxy-6-hydroxymethyldihydropteridine diphosphokinase [Paenibacillus hemerocallicola]TNJ62517.1 2-amino-4-hydroxy-6-hydroxymethyldihydropteridine diphosphokinase [Paenibacillus hemerocallicola]